MNLRLRFSVALLALGALGAAAAESSVTVTRVRAGALCRGPNAKVLLPHVTPVVPQSGWMNAQTRLIRIRSSAGACYLLSEEARVSVERKQGADENLDVAGQRGGTP